MPEHTASATDVAQQARLAAFAELQYVVEASQDALHVMALQHPRRDDLVFSGRPALFEMLTRDGLFPLAAANIPRDGFGSEMLFCAGDQALYPHPALAPMRELVHVLAELALAPNLRVAVALDPHRRTLLADAPVRLLLDRWSGIKLTRENLDSLDAHDVGVPTFHAAIDRSPAAEMFFPLLGTWFDWVARKDNPDDDFKRLYVREVRPPTDRNGELLAAVHNRELHSERDTKHHLFTHVDGKVCRYDIEGYEPSVNCPRAPLPAPTRSRKLWRVDGDLTDAQWCELVGLHFRGNELIEEHLRDAFPAWPEAAGAESA